LSGGTFTLVRPTLNITSVRVEMTWVKDGAELDAVRRRCRPFFSDGDARAAFGRSAAGLEKGFSVPVRKDDQLICRIYVFKPIVVDDHHGSRPRAPSLPARELLPMTQHRGRNRSSLGSESGLPKAASPRRVECLRNSKPLARRILPSRRRSSET
jgi:hypothetical protein